MSNGAASFTAGATYTSTEQAMINYGDMNNLANDIRAWGGDVNAGGYSLSNLSALLAKVLYADGAASDSPGVRVRVAGANRWTFGADGTSETGGNEGSDLALMRWSDSGTWLDTPLLIDRSSGVMVLLPYGPRLLVGHMSDDGANRLQVNGTVSISSVADDSGLSVAGGGVTAVFGRSSLVTGARLGTTSNHPLVLGANGNFKTKIDTNGALLHDGAFLLGGFGGNQVCIKSVMAVQSSGSTGTARVMAVASDYNSSFRSLTLTQHDATTGGTTYGFGNACIALLDAFNSNGLVIGLNNAYPIYFAPNGAEKMRLTGGGLLGLGTGTPTISGTGKHHFAGDTARVFDAANTPSSSGAAGNPGEMRFDTSYLYVCVAANTWKRLALAAF